MATIAPATTQRPLLARSYVDGEWVDGGGESADVTHPGDGRVVSQVSYADAQQVERAVAAATRAKAAWANEHVALRVERLAKVADVLEERLDEVVMMVTAEMGKTVTEARESVAASADYFRILGQDALRHYGKVSHNMWDPSQNKRVITQYVPHGVVAMLTPWNFPIAIPVEGFASALATGNTVIWKPSELTPGCSQLLTEVIVAADFPPGVVNLVQGAGPVGAALVEHEDVAMVQFTGSTATGRRIAANAGIKKLLMELGGNGPMVITEDANIDAAVKATAHACFYVAGQCCTAGERILVQSSIHEEFVEKLAARVSEMKVGDPFDEKTDMGPLSNSGSLEKTKSHVADAQRDGARVVAGGSSTGMYHDPTVLIDVSPEMEIAREETFGPVAPIIKFDTHEEALRIANDSPYGLNTAVWTSSLKTAWIMAEGLEAGTVHVNESTNHWEMFAPFGGVKQSGIGRIDGEDAMREFTTPKQITFDLDNA